MGIQAWRVPYLEEKIHEQFRTHIYGWVSYIGVIDTNTISPPELTCLCYLSIDLGGSGD